MVEVITKLYELLAQSYIAQALMIFLEAVCMKLFLVWSFQQLATGKNKKDITNGCLFYWYKRSFTGYRHYQPVFDWDRSVAGPGIGFECMDRWFVFERLSFSGLTVLFYQHLVH